MDRLDSLPNGWPIWQNDNYFKFTLDAVILAAFPVLRRKAKVIELGAGTGAISLLLAARGCQDITGVEINPATYGLFCKSIAENQLSGQVKALLGDIRLVNALPAAGQYHLVVANPPYRKVGHGRLRQTGAQTACHEALSETKDFIAAARHLLQYKGKLAMVHLPERLPEILHYCLENKLEPKRLQIVHSFVDKPPALFLLEAMHGGKPGLQVLPPMIVYQDRHTYSRQLLDCYQVFAAHEQKLT